MGQENGISILELIIGLLLIGVLSSLSIARHESFQDSLLCKTAIHHLQELHTEALIESRSNPVKVEITRDSLRLVGNKVRTTAIQCHASSDQEITYHNPKTITPKTVIFSKGDYQCKAYFSLRGRLRYDCQSLVLG